MKLFANGCSFTWGGDIMKSLHDPTGQLLDENATGEINDYRLNSTWPKHLSDKLSCNEFHNHSLGCGSNARIVRKTFEFFMPRIIQKEDLNDWFCVIQWTDPSRIEFFNVEENCYTTMKHDMTINEKDKNPNLEYYDDPIDLQLRHSYYKKFNNRTWSDIWFQQICLLGYFFKNNSINYMFSSMLHPTFFFNSDQIDFLKNNFNWCGGNDIRYWAIPDLKIDMTSHPTLLGHKQIAEKFYNYITKKDINP